MIIVSEGAYPFFDGFETQRNTGSRKMLYKILLVEDDARIREAILDFFSEKASEYDVDTAGDGPQGLTKIEENTYDLILLDVMLPQMSGFEMMMKIRRTSDVPVIFMTARTSEEDRLRGYELGCDDYACKPFPSRSFWRR